MPDRRNVLWEKHRLYLPEMRLRATHRCRECKFFVGIKGKAETRYGCVANIKVYNSLERQVPPVIPVFDVIKRIGLEGLEQTLKYNDPDAQSCGKFQLRPVEE
ncbi:hypothetical protein [Desulfoscipio geothermicus]|uniref:Uncharacterized protein n=1 Tax=Desulfoscipio geothermicus DSM 3669 TaxID=1121426 RepID=A0A1I6DCI4_9FIRM|nr:hypothetical protein [Desulfoscipio geothermicus]SFR03077.1 hypothetical protein SAMN05660706_108133 [Desulfoscipio geothermicus DSM 3669]